MATGPDAVPNSQLSRGCIKAQNVKAPGYIGQWTRERGSSRPVVIMEVHEMGLNWLTTLMNSTS